MSETGSHHRLWRELALHAVALLVTAVVMWPYLGLGRMDFRYPIALFATKDGTYYATQVKILLETGWVFHHPDLGAPFGLDLYDFAHFDALHLLIMKLIGYAVADWAVVLNVYYLLTFPLTTATALLFFRHLRMNVAVAVALAVLFTFQPYHHIRGQGHIMLAAYYLLPLQMLAVVWLLSSLGLRDGEGVSLWRSWRCRLACGITFIAVFAGHYYTAFVLISCAAAAVYTGLRMGAWRPVVHAGLLAGVVAVGFTLNLLPNALYWASQGGNREASAKHPMHVEIHSLRLAPMLLPVIDHRVEAMRRLTEQYRKTTPLQSNEQQSIGLVAAIGFVGLLGWGLFGARRDGLIAGLGVVTLALVLFTTLSGFGAVFAHLVTPQMHGLSRVAILLALLGLTAVGLVATAGLDQVGRPLAGTALVVAAGVFGLLDEYPARRPYDPHLMATQYAPAQRFAEAIQQAVPAGTVIHQMPARHFPFGGYQQFVPYLYTKGLRWTCPAMINRRGIIWCREIEGLPPEAMLERLALCDVGGLLLEPGERTAAMRDLLTRLGVPRIESGFGKTFFDLRAVTAEIRSRYGETERQQRRLAASMPITVRWGTELEAVGPGGTSRGSQTKQAAVELVNHLSEPVRVHLTMGLVRLASGPRFTLSSQAFRRPIEVPEGRLAVDVILPPGRTPLTIQADGRKAKDEAEPHWFRVEGLGCRVIEATDVTRR